MTLAKANTQEIISTIASMSREKVMYDLTHAHLGFKLDFTSEHLDSLSLDQLRHILFSVRLHE